MLKGAERLGVQRCVGSCARVNNGDFICSLLEYTPGCNIFPGLMSLQAQEVTGRCPAWQEDGFSQHLPCSAVPCGSWHCHGAGGVHLADVQVRGLLQGALFFHSLASRQHLGLWLQFLGSFCPLEKVGSKEPSLAGSSVPTQAGGQPLV